MAKNKTTLESVEAVRVADVIDFIDKFLPLIVFVIGMIAFILMISAGMSLSAASASGMATSPGLNAQGSFYRGMSFFVLGNTIYLTYKLIHIKRNNKK